MQPCAVPTPKEGATLGQLAFDYTTRLQKALQDCNDDKKALREWASEKS